MHFGGLRPRDLLMPIISPLQARVQVCASAHFSHEAPDSHGGVLGRTAATPMRLHKDNFRRFDEYFDAESRAGANRSWRKANASDATAMRLNPHSARLFRPREVGVNSLKSADPGKIAGRSMPSGEEDLGRVNNPTAAVKKP
jgi:hypothetical protein